MSFRNWCEWAKGNTTDPPSNEEETWRRVARYAESDARYENPNEQPDAYRDEIGNRFPDTKDQFTTVCRNHQLCGAKVGGEVPLFLSRCVRRRSLKTHLKQRLEEVERGGVNFSGTAVENHDVELQSVPADFWVQADDVLPDPMNDTLHLAHFKSNRVFATLAEDDKEPPGDHSPGFFQRLRTVQRPGWSLAAEAEDRLALAPAPSTGEEYLFLYYDASSYPTFRYPVPPDAEFWPLFRPIERTDTAGFGRTCPGGLPCNEERAEAELVHANQPPTSSDRIWMRSLGTVNRT